VVVDESLDQDAVSFYTVAGSVGGDGGSVEGCHFGVLLTLVQVALVPNQVLGLVLEDGQVHLHCLLSLEHEVLELSCCSGLILDVYFSQGLHLAVLHLSKSRLSLIIPIALQIHAHVGASSVWVSVLLLLNLALDWFFLLASEAAHQIFL
jgi:hypothetical protein